MITLFSFLFRRSWKVALLAGILGGVGAAATTAILSLINELLLTPRENGAIRFFALAAMMGTATYASDMLMVRLGVSFARDMQIKFASRLHLVPLARFEQVGAPAIYNVLTGDIQALQTSLRAVA